jgi:hypothetical protein
MWCNGTPQVNASTYFMIVDSILNSVCFSDCGIHAHKHCKDLVVMECRSKLHGLALGRSATFNGGRYICCYVVLYVSEH